MKANLRIIFFFVAVKIIFHLSTAQSLGFHRDELLYLSLGKHLDWGYWSNPPFIGLLAWVSQHIWGGSLLATHIFPALAGGLLMWLALSIVTEFGGGRYAQILCGVAMLFSPAMLRTAALFQPVVFDLLFWTLAIWCTIRLVNTRDKQWLLWLGISLGVGLLNKYSVVFLAICLPAAALLTPQRRWLAAPFALLAVGIALLIVSPNLIWQWHYHFPVVHHMQQLSENQLVSVKPFDFFIDQLLMNGWAFLIWLPGLYWLIRTPGPWRMFGWLAVLTIGLLLVLHGKGYYTLGIYPFLIPAGAVFWETKLSKNWSRVALPTLLGLSSLIFIPIGVPLFSAEKLVRLMASPVFEPARRWEGNSIHALPQDYADMLGWLEMAALVDTAVARNGGTHNCLIYGDNYGEASAIGHFSPSLEAVSFSDSYLLWVPDTLPAYINTFIYVNDALGEDVQNGFDNIQKIGEVTNPLAREHGTGVWLCREPRGSFPDFWARRAREVKAELMK